MFAAQCHQVFNAVSVFTSTHAPCLNVVYIICHRTAYLTWDKVTGRISKMLEINLRVALHGCKVCGIIIIIFKNVENFLLKYLHRYKKLYYICGMNTVFEQGHKAAAEFDADLHDGINPYPQGTYQFTEWEKGWAWYFTIQSRIDYADAQQEQQKFVENNFAK
jgi:hypothetical protein